jgi:predicted P-loop ATPase
MNDYIFNSIYLACKKVVEKSNKDVCFDLIHSSFTPKYNPIHEWFEKNKHIQTEGNISKLAACIQSDLSLKDAKFVEDFLEKWMLSIIASAHGIYSILCLVLTGQVQGTGKSNFFRDLLPEPLRWLFTTNKLDGKEADVGQLMCSKWLIMDDEFGGKSKQDEKRFKELISKDVFSIRKPYGRYFEDMKRLAVLCGTTNEEQVINDLTGNRRIIPIQVNLIDEKKFYDVDKTELFIELYHKFRLAPRSWFLIREDIERLKEVCFDANQVSAEQELPLKYFSKDKYNHRENFMTASSIRSIIEERSKIRLSPQKLSITLKQCGFDYGRERIDGIQCRGFYVIDKSSNNYNVNNEDKPALPF